MLKPVLTLILGLFSLVAWAQRKSDTVIYFVKYPAQVVQKATDADYIIQVTPPDEQINRKLFIVRGYYLDGKLMFITSSSRQNALIYQGAYLSFYPNGKKMVVKQYDHGTTTGEIITYYPNGKLYNIKTVNWGQMLLTQCNDTAGNVIADKGKGKWIIYDGNFEKINEEGAVSDGVATGVWKVKINDSVDIEKTFNDGRIMASMTIYKKKPLSLKYAPSDTIYTSVDTAPYFPAGLEAFYMSLAKTIRYPADARDANIQGRVVVQFVVERDGTLNDFKIVSGIGHGCNEEAIKAIQLSAPWIPATMNGKPVRAAYTVPIQFTLSQ